MSFQLYFDGACEPKNPGGVATGGWLLVAPDGLDISSGHHFVCEGPLATNNVAEWSALGFGLRWLVDHITIFEEIPAAQLEILGDSQLVINQLTGAWRCNKERLQKLRARCLEHLTAISSAGVIWSAEWIARDQNHRADVLSRMAYEQHTKQRFPQRRKAGVT